MMTRLVSTFVLLLSLSVPAFAQRPGAFSTLTVTGTATNALRVGCTVAGAPPCTGGILAGPIDVSTITSGGAIGIASGTPADTSYKLYNVSGSLYFNGVALATGASVSGTTGKLSKFTGASTLGDSIASESGSTITVAGTLAATTLTGAYGASALTGTIANAVQDTITRLGTVTLGVWNSSTKIGLAYGGTNADLSATGGTSQFLRQAGVGAAVTVVRPAVADLSDAANVALLNALNVFTAPGLHQFASAATGENAIMVRNTNSGAANRATVHVGNDLSTSVLYLTAYTSAFTTSGPAVADGGQLTVGRVGGLSIVADHASGTIRFYTGGTTQRWGINAAGDKIRASATQIVDAVSTPTIASGFGTSPSVAGTAYAFLLTNGSTANTGGVINFNTTFTTVPICTASAGSTVFGPIATVATTTTVTLAYASTSTGTINVLCRGY